jgi:hypothetical protein
MGQTAVAAGLSASTEKQGIILGNDGRPADVYIWHWVRGQNATLDVTVVSLLQDALVQRAAEHPGHALEHRLEEKMRKSFDACYRQWVVFPPTSRRVVLWVAPGRRDPHPQPFPVPGPSDRSPRGHNRQAHLSETRRLVAEGKCCADNYKTAELSIPGHCRRLLSENPNAPEKTLQCSSQDPKVLP